MVFEREVRGPRAEGRISPHLQRVPQPNQLQRARAALGELSTLLRTRRVVGEQRAGAMEFLRNFEAEIDASREVQRRGRREFGERVETNTHRRYLESFISAGNEMIRQLRRVAVIENYLDVSEDSRSRRRGYGESLADRAGVWIENLREMDAVSRQYPTLQAQTHHLLAEAEQLRRELWDEGTRRPLRRITLETLLQQASNLYQQLWNFHEDSGTLACWRLQNDLKRYWVEDSCYHRIIEFIGRLEEAVLSNDRELVEELRGEEARLLREEIRGYEQRTHYMPRGRYGYAQERYVFSTDAERREEASSLVEQIEALASRLPTGEDVSDDLRIYTEMISIAIAEELERERIRPATLKALMNRAEYQGARLERFLNIEGTFSQLIEIQNSAVEARGEASLEGTVEQGVAYGQERPIRRFRSEAEARRHLRRRGRTIPRVSSEVREFVESAHDRALEILGRSLDPATMERIRRNPPLVIIDPTLVDADGEYWNGTNIITVKPNKRPGELHDGRDLVRVFLHEYSHYISYLGWGYNIRLRQNGTYLNIGYKKHLLEGLTELFAQQFTREQGVSPTFVAYHYETSVAFFIQRIVGDEILRRAYLSGDFTEVRRRLNRRLRNEQAFELIVTSTNGVEALDVLREMMEDVGIDYQRVMAADPIMEAIWGSPI